MKSVSFKHNSNGCLEAGRTVTSVTLAGRLQAGISEWYQAWQQRRQYREDMNHIAQFSSYLLRDIGLNSADVAEAKRGSVYTSTDRMGRPG